MILYPTLGLTWETVCPDAGLALAYARVLQRLDSSEFCSTSPDRLAHVAHVPLRDMAWGCRGGEAGEGAGGEGA